MIVVALIAAALVVDRFVLLPEFDGGTAGAAFAILAWLSVNLVPALAWLVRHRSDPELSGAQRLQGALAILVATALGILPMLIWYGATGAPLS